MVHPPFRSCGRALLGLLALAAAIHFHGSQARAQLRPFPVTAPRISASTHGAAAARHTYGMLPLSFEPNRGQAPQAVRYMTQGQGYSLALTSTEARFTLRQPPPRKGSAAQRLARTSSSSSSRTAMLRMRLIGAAANAPVQGRRALPGKVNYLVGRDPSQWRTSIPTYGEVRCTGVYPGVDLIYYGSQRQLEYDFVVAPRADPSKIALQFDGARRLTVDCAGDLVVGLRGGSVRWHKPSVYQQVNGAHRPVAGRYVLKGAGRVGFAVARYDVRSPLVIDPVLFYSTYIGGSGNDQALAIAIDSAGSAYVTGNTTSQDFPGTIGGFAGGSESFIAKLDPSGSFLVYSTYLGGNNDTTGRGIAVDGAGGAYIVGDTTATNLPVVRGYQTTGSGSVDAFVARLNPTGAALVYCTYLGGAAFDSAQGVVLGGNGYAYVVGYTASTDFPTVSPLQAANAGGTDAFVAKVDTLAAGAASLLYSTYLGGSGNDRAFGIAVTFDSGPARIYITGDTDSADFPTLYGYQNSIPGPQSAFVSCLSAVGDVLFYSTYLGGSGTHNSGTGITTDLFTNVYITGVTNSADFPTRNALQATAGGADDAFIAKIIPGFQANSSLAYSTYLGGPGDDAGRGIAVDILGRVYITGNTYSSFSPVGISRGFVAKIAPDGSRLLYSTLLSDSDFDSTQGIAVDPAGNVFLAGFTASEDFPVTPGAFQTGLAGGANAFALRMPTFAPMDFNHDNHSDLVFQNAVDGRLLYWTMSGDRAVRNGFLTPRDPGTGWNLAASADFKGDNNAGLIFQSSISGDLVYWLMNGTQETSFAFLTPKNPGADWKIVGSGTFGRDATVDLLFQNTVNGDLFVWIMIGTRMGYGIYVTPQNPGRDWKVVAVGDINGDGQPDILFQNSSSGNLYVWYMHGTTLFSGGFLNPANPGAGWNVAALADLTGDGRPEIIFQNKNTGDLAYWVMNGSNLRYIGIPQPSNPGGAVWKLVGPH